MLAVGLVGFLHIVIQRRQAKQIKAPVFLQMLRMLHDFTATGTWSQV